MKFYFKQADAVIFYSGLRKEIASQIMPGIAKKMFVGWNTLDLSEFRKTYDKLKKTGKKTVKEELGQNFKPKFNLIFIGRLLPDKGIELMINTIHNLVKDCDIALHIIGSGEKETFIKQDKLFNKNIFYYGAIYDIETTGKYLYASDLFLMPGYVGLSLIHAFAFGLPVVTCRTENDGPFHSPEIEYLKHGYNGILSSKTGDQISIDIKALLADTRLLEEMKINAEKTAYEMCTLERMLNGFEQAINYVS
jgi:glycosyltransferase involved in cell wall biosynthesis